MFSSLFRRKNKHTDFESTLNGLSSDVIEHQANLADIRIRERRATLWITTCLMLFWATYVALWYFGIVDWLISVDGSGLSGLYKLIAWSGVVVGPIMMLFARRIAKSWYTRIGSREEIRLRDLHTSLVKTLEEVKVKAPYNEARSLLERYGPTVGMTPHDVAPLTPQSTPMKAKHATTPIPRTKELPQTPTAGSIGTLNTVNTAGPATPATPRSPQTPIRTQQTQLNPQTPTSADNLHTQTSPARQRSWYDRLADAILGDDPSNLSGDVSQKYALICEKCAKHNGLVPREQYMELRWECRFCQHMNLPPRRKAVARTALQGDGGGSGGTGSSTHNTHKPSPLSQVNQEEKEKAEQEKDEKKEEKTEQLPAQSNPKPMPKSKS
ncbi:hypothetical protein E3P98_01057 [Wallemia ichthyophaga]|nr:hypothetical protein E3P98_01057 [Wallemia ichthyophaga]